MIIEVGVDAITEHNTEETTFPGGLLSFVYAEALAEGSLLLMALSRHEDPHFVPLSSPPGSTVLRHGVRQRWRPDVPDSEGEEV